MRIMIKGGVWKNTEDEILKAAVMKYGLNQWPRISSLLVRKSAKQCKARWYEWLDPAIKKTEWTREEDEKLLHLAKLMPTQWRTIAPIVGRTAAQCLERYEKLLDQVLHKDGGYDPADDPRRLRPGEIDPNPESKPARPDPVDMDEDEKEMLSEARARLANTRGKKAKRKAREKQLEDARRLASLQKKRELKAAGIELRGKWKRKRGIDYNAEVAFEAKPASGFYDTSDELHRTKAIQEEFRPVTIEELEGKRRKDVEAALVKQDLAKAKIQQRHDAPAALARAQAMNEAQMPRRRGKMMLPAPQVSEEELRMIAKMGTDGDIDPDVAAAGAGGEATQQLLGDYETNRLSTAIRTPRTPAVGGDRILEAAEKLAKMQTSQTPLLGGEGMDWKPEEFAGVVPTKTVAATPNPLATPLRGTPAVGGTPAIGATPSMGGGATPAVASIAGVASTPAVAGTPLRGMVSGGATPSATPSYRDELNLNDPGLATPAASRRKERERNELLRAEVREGLRSLPAPKNEYEIQIPDADVAMDDKDDDMELDAADIDARRRKAEQERLEIEMRKRSQVLQRGLPRPHSLQLLPEPREGVDLSSLPLRDAAEEMLNREMLRMLQHDAAKYPIKHTKREKKRKRGPDNAAPELEDIELEELEEAAKLLRAEVNHIRTAMGHGDVSDEQYADAWLATAKDAVWMPDQNRYGRLQQLSNVDRLKSEQDEFKRAKEEMDKEAERSNKLAKKCDVLMGGLQQRASRLQEQAVELTNELHKASVELTSFQALAEHEGRVMPARLEAWRDAVERQKQREGDLQERYKLLLQQRTDLRSALAH